VFWILAGIAAVVEVASASHGDSIASKILADSKQEPPYHVTGPLVSVVIPTYHEEDYIEAALLGIKNQTYGPIEIVISDASQDQEAIDKITNISSIYGCTMVHTFIKNISLGRNLGAEAAIGDILIFLDADCVMAQNFVEKLVSHLSDTIKLSHGLDVFYLAPVIHQSMRILISNNKPYTYTSGRGICIHKEDFNEIGKYNIDIDPTQPHMREDLDIGRKVIQQWGSDSIYLDKTAFVAEAYRRPFSAVALTDKAWTHRGYRSGQAIDGLSLSQNIKGEF